MADFGADIEADFEAVGFPVSVAAAPSKSFSPEISVFLDFVHGFGNRVSHVSSMGSDFASLNLHVSSLAIESSFWTGSSFDDLSLDHGHPAALQSSTACSP